MERRLAAVMIADVAGYGRLSQADEEGTRARFQADLHEVFETQISAHHGRLVNTMGDALLVEFHSVVDALRCAIEVQRAEAKRNADLPTERRMQFRIGINLGDVIVEGDDIHGDGVNITDRLQQLADQGGIAISGMAYDHVVHKIDVGFEFLGKQRVKSLSEPVRVYRVRMDVATVRAKELRPARRWVVPAGAAVVLVLVAGVVAALWPWATSQRLPGAGLPADKPSIAVLPFDNLSGDADQAYFAEGLTDDLITDLSKISGLFVIARNSTSGYDPTVDVREVAEQLDVRYVLQGSVRRAGNSVRINAQLIDGTTGRNIWAERYDRDYAEVFVLQDEVIRRIVEAFSVRLTESEETQIARLPTRNLEAYDFYIRAEQKVYDLSAESLSEALSLYEKAIALDAQFADAHAGYARALVDILSFAYENLLLSALARQQAYDAAGRALELNPETPRAFAVLGILQVLDGRHEEAIASVEKALALDPSSADAELNLAIILTYAGKHNEALAAMERVLQLNPKPQSQVYDYYAFVLFMNRQYEEALQALDGYALKEQSELGLEVLAMVYAKLGRTEDAHRSAKLLLEKAPAMSLASARVIYAHHRRKEDVDHRLDALRDAGIPDWPFGFHPPADEQLGGAAVRALAIDKTWVGHQHNGAPFVMQVNAKSDYVQRAPQGMIIGKVTFEGDFMCTQSPAALLGRKFCSPVFRNPEGSREKQDEYVFVDFATIWYFSVAP
jgi:adenylate cyclase